MREVIFLNFGNASTYVSTHFWNLNDEMFKVEDKFNIDNSVFYDDYYNPRNMIFDFSENIRPYFISNEKLSDKAKKQIEDEVKNMNKTSEVKKFEMDGGKNQSNFVELMHEFGIDEDEYNQFKSTLKNEEEDVHTSKQTKKNNEENGQNIKLSASEIFKLPDEKIYDYLDFQHNIKNWNDFLQPKFNRRNFNEIFTSDVDIFSRRSYIKGNEFLHSENFAHSYLEPFEDNFRKYLENCDKLELLHINVDFNSFWGGVSNSMMETINESIPKVLKVFFGVDSHSSFYNLDDDSFDVEKFINYLWYFTDMNSHKYSNSIFMPIYRHQNPSLIKQTFGYAGKTSSTNTYSHDPVYEFYFSSLSGVNLHNLYMPLRSKYFNNSSILNNLIHTTSSSLNFIESDIFFNMDNLTEVQGLQNNGAPFNLSRNTKAKDFSWRKLMDTSYRLNKFNSSIIHGFSDKYKILGDKLEGFLMKHSSISYTAVENLDIPLCFPHRIFSNKKEIFLKDLSVMTNYRPFAEYPLLYFKYFPDYYRDYDLDIKKYLVNHDNSKYIEYREKIEEFYNIVDSYDYLNEGYGLKIKGRNYDEEDEQPDY